MTTPTTLQALGEMLNAHDYATNVRLSPHGQEAYQFDMVDGGGCEPMHCSAMVVDGRVVASAYYEREGVQLSCHEGDGYESFQFYLDVFFG